MKTLFITSVNVLDIQTAEEVIGLTLTFEERTIGKVHVTPDWVRFFWTSPRDQLAVTVIELSPTAITILSRTQLSRL
ncbi:hypothetical protein NL526_30075, partial [Klebsiella pneumoniae]|nr:hypothetical protein [Klebsiella pneumoniae]